MQGQAMTQRFATRSITSTFVRPGRRTNVVVRASKEGPAPMAAKVFGVLTAVQLAVVPMIALPAHADFLPKTATSQSARDALNAKTSGLPSLKKAGKELTGGKDPIGAKSAKDVGRKLDKNTPSVDLKKNPKDIVKDVSKGAKKAVSTINMALGDFAVADGAVGIEARDRQSQNDETPAKNSKAGQGGTNQGMTSFGTGKLPSPNSREMAAPPQGKVSGQSPGGQVGSGVSNASDLKPNLNLPNPAKAAQNLPNPAEAAKSLFK